MVGLVVVTERDLEVDLEPGIALDMEPPGAWGWIY